MKKNEKNTKPYIIAITFQKGGTGKTSVAVNLAATLSTKRPYKKCNRRNKVLLIDFDVHAAASHYLGVDDEKELGLYDVLVGNCKFDEAIKTIEYQYGCTGKTCSIDILPAFSFLQTIENNWQNYEEPKNLFRNSIKTSSKFDTYDYVIVDCPPESNCLLSNVYNVCNYYIFPIHSDPFSHNNLAATYEQIGALSTNDIKRNILGCVINNYEKYDESDLSKAYIKVHNDSVYIDCFSTIIPHSRFHNHSIYFCEPIPFFNRNIHQVNALTSAYNSFTNEVIEKIKSIEANERG